MKYCLVSLLISASFLMSGCGDKTPSVGHIYTSTIESDDALVHYRLEDSILMLGFKNKLSFVMNNLVITVEQVTNVGTSDSQTVVNDLKSNEFFTISEPVVHNNIGEINIIYYYSVTDNVTSFKDGTVKIKL